MGNIRMRRIKPGEIFWIIMIVEYVVLKKLEFKFSENRLIAMLQFDIIALPEYLLLLLDIKQVKRKYEKILLYIGVISLLLLHVLYPFGIGNMFVIR